MKTETQFLIAIIPLVAWIIIGSSAQASVIAYSVSGDGTEISIEKSIVGLEFTTGTNIIIDSLGVIDIGTTGLSEQHEVGLWKSDGTLLAQVVIPIGITATLDNGFRYQSISPLLLDAGFSYRIGAFFDTRLDSYLGEDSSNMSLISATEISLTKGGFFSTSSSNLDFPDFFITDYRAAANFQFHQVPEPLTFTLMCLGLAGLGFRQHRNKRAM